MIKLQVIDWLNDNNHFIKDSFKKIINAFDLILNLLNDLLIIIQMNQIKMNFF